jgi:putative nucleotidyltransferase with HDIG domain
MDKDRVLIVDDDPAVRDVLANILAFTGHYATDIAKDGFEGISKVRDNDYAVIFTDITMPGMSGIDFMKESRKVKPSLPVVVVTGYSTIENAVNAMREGARDFITKPFSVQTVTSVADRIVSERRLINGILRTHDTEAFIGHLNAELSKKLQEISIFQAISTELDGFFNNSEIYEKIVEMAMRLLVVREASFGILENGVLKIKRATNVRRCEIPVRNSVLETVIRTGSHVIAPVGELNPHTGLALTSPFLSIPFTINSEVFGVINVSNKGDGTAFTEDEISLALSFAKKAAQRIENNALYEVLYTNLVNTLKSLVNTIEARDSYTKQHSERVTSLALATAEAMRLSDDDKDAIRFGGYLHDVGKVGVRDTVLMKAGPLTPEEMDEIKQHPVIGGNIIKPLRFFPKERELILHHHERLDGSGYPDGISGEKIPIIARILAVADAYDAITSSRPYRQARTHDMAAAELTRCSDTQFDAEVVKAFLFTQPERKGPSHA